MATVDGKWLSKEGLTYLWSKLKTIFTKQTETNVIANLGAKNMLYISNTPGYTATSHGRTFTVLSDGGIKITGASSDSSNADFYVIGSWGNRSILLNENKDSCRIRLACDTDYGYNQIRLRVMNRSTGSTVNETGVETNKDVKLSHVITTVFVSVFPSVTLPEDGIVVYPMIRRAEITDSTFQPFSRTNRELTVLTEEKIEMEDVFGYGKALASGDSMNDLPIGKFVCQNAATAAGVTNGPWTDAGYFGHTERSVLAADRYIQVAYRNDDSFSMAKRRYSGSWGAWVYSTNYIPPISGSIFDYADSLPATSGGVYFARQSSASGTGKPVNNKRYVYQIFIYATTVASITAYENEDATVGHMYMALKTNSTWGSWVKIPAQEEINVIANAGAKNQLPITTASTTHKGITFTVNNDGTITVNGTNDGTGASIFDVSTQAICGLANGDYILSGCPSNGSTAGYRMDVTRSPGSAIQDTGSGALFTIGGSYTVNQYRIVVNSGVSVDHVVFYPMIRRAEITDPTFVPYGMTNAELTVLTDEDRAALAEVVDEGTKSLFPIGVSGKTYSNVTTSVDAEGKITVNGTNENTSSGILYQDLVTGKSTYRDTRYTLPVGKYACLASGVTGLEIQVYCHDGNTAKLLFAGSGNSDGVFEYTTVLKTSYPYIAFRLAINPNASFTNTIVKPMICTAADWNVSQKFVPYAPTNRQLYDSMCRANVTLASDADLDKIKTHGFYHGQGANITHRPVSGSYNFTLMVIESGEFIIQVFKQLNSAGDPYIFVRRFYVYNTSWDSWYQFTGTAV